MDLVCTHTKNKTISNRLFFLIEKCFEDLRQDEKHVPDLLEPIIQPPGPVKEELRQKLFKMTKFGPEITKIQPKSLKSGLDPKVKSSKMGLSIDPRQFLSRPTLFAIFGPARGQIFGKDAKKY